jgi:putative transposase
MVVVDGGKDLGCNYLKILLAIYECDRKKRPKAQSRFGSVIERMFGTTNKQFIYTLRGNTQMTKNPRELTKEVNPKKLAVWIFEGLFEKLSEYFYEIYDKQEHPALNMSPREAYEEAKARLGNRNHRRIAYDKEFLLNTMPTTRKGTAKVQPGSGVKINYLYYWSNAFKDEDIEGTDVWVRYEPFDASIAYAYVKNRWVECISEYAPVFQGLSEKAIRMATAELLARKKRHKKNRAISAKELAEFIRSNEASEGLRLQLLKDREARSTYYGDRSRSASTPSATPSSDEPADAERGSHQPPPKQGDSTYNRLDSF